jgi:hypothetical protein
MRTLPVNWKSSKVKLATAGVALLVAFGAGAARGVDVTLLARCGLAFTAAGGAAAWWVLRAQGAARAPRPVRLAVISRVGLGHRTAAALLEVDGKSFLVVHGEGFAQVVEPSAAPTQQRFADALEFEDTDRFARGHS